MYSKGLLFIVLIYFAQPIFAQKDTTNNRNWIKDDICFVAIQHKGKIRKNYDTEFPLKDSYYSELSVLWQMNGNKSWHSAFKYPLSGFGINYSQLGNDTVLGQAISLYPQWFIQIRKQKKLQINIKLGVGLAYFTKHYNRIDNPENEIIGSRITNFTTLGANISYRFMPQLSIFAGASLMHYSNGHTSIPNIGMNDRPYSFGILYKPQKTKITGTTLSNKNDRSIHYNLRLGRGVHEMAHSTFPVGGPSYPIYNIALFLSKQVSSVNDIHFGHYTTYYSGYYHFMLLEQIFQGEERKNAFVHSVFAGHEFLIGHFGFTQELVINYWNPFYKELNFNRSYSDVEENEYWKIYLGLRLQFDYYPFKPANDHRNNLYVGTNLKTTVSKADYVELHVGYSL